MSITVELHELAERMAGYSFAYLVTVTADDRAHVVAVSPVLVGDRLVVGDLGRRTLANAAERPGVTLVWPPSRVGGYSLIVDGAASATHDASAIAVRPSRAVMHRPAPGQADSACGSDCVELPVGAVTSTDVG